MKVTRIFDILDHIKENYQKDDLLCKRQGSEWQKFSIDDYIDISHSISCALLEMGLQKGDKIASIMQNRPAWNFVDMGVMMAGMVHVPVYPTLSPDDYTHIINHSDAKCVIVGAESVYKRVEPSIPSFVNKPKIITIDKIEGLEQLKDIVELGRSVRDKWLPVVMETKAAVKPDDLATLIYTSGTTGLPKGVMLSHKNFVTNTLGIVQVQTNDHTANILSFLPLCHVYERVVNYKYQYLGASIYYAGSLATIAKDLKDIHADGFCAVPRVFEMMCNKLYEAGKDLKGIKKMIYFWAFNLASKYDYYNDNWFYKAKIALADKLVYSKWRENLGGHTQIIVSGGSAIQERIVRLFSAAKLRIYEGYGLTETSPVIAVNNPRKNILKIGTVGEVLPCIEFKLAEDGEILTKGDCLMMGYYKDEEYTKQVIDEEGWFHTGDIGTMVEGRFLKITDRKKEIFKLSTGKYVAPQVLENKLKESYFIENAFVLGEKEKIASAIIVPDFNTFHFWCAKHKVHFSTHEDMVQNPAVIKRVQKEVSKVNAKLAEHEQIRKFKLVADIWDTKTGELSQTLKLKRHFLQKKYADLIDEMYNHTQQE